MRMFKVALMLAVLALLVGVGFAADAAVTGYDSQKLYLVSGDLTTDGIQYSDIVTTATADTAVVVLEKSITLEPDPSVFPYKDHYDLVQVYILTETEIAASSSVNADISLKVQAKNADETTYVDVCDWQLYENVGTSFTAKVLKGYAEVQSGFNEIPFDLKILMKCNEDNEGKAKVKNTSYVEPVWLKY